MNSDEENSAVEGRWVLMRDVAVFQLKLLVDGFRDLLLVPVSLVTGVIGLLNFRQEKGAEFYELLRVGRRSEQWINLFGAARPDDASGAGQDASGSSDLDKVVARLESFIVDEYRKGGVTAQAKDRLDAALDSLGRLAERNRDNGEP